MRRAFSALFFCSFLVAAACSRKNIPPPLLGVAAPVQSITGIQNLMGQQYSCSGTPCATGNIAPPTQPPQNYAVTTRVASPSLSGSSTQLQMFPMANQPGDVLYYTPSLGEFPNATNFMWSFAFRIDQDIWDPNGDGGSGAPMAMQALEFDFNDYFPGAAGTAYDYNFSSQCYLQLQKDGGPQWQIWGRKQDGTIGWIPSGLACNPLLFGKNQWHQITWIYSIDQTARTTHYISLQIDGNAPTAIPPNVNPVTPLQRVQDRPALEVQFQQDARGLASPPRAFTEWVDNVTLAFW
jgi:hypothetical protein